MGQLRFQATKNRYKHFYALAPRGMCSWTPTAPAASTQAARPSGKPPVENIPVTPDYVIGPGDELLIRAWGQIDVDYRAVVDRNGMINIPRVGSIPVAGVPYKDISAHVRTAVSRNFRNFELMVTMGQLRSIQIFVVGQASRPGNYTVSSLSTLVNAVFAAGGPSTRGSMRAIQLKRANQVVTEFDVYDLLLRGDKSKDAPLLPDGSVVSSRQSGFLVGSLGGSSPHAGRRHRRARGLRANDADQGSKGLDADFVSVRPGRGRAQGPEGLIP